MLKRITMSGGEVGVKMRLSGIELRVRLKTLWNSLRYQIL